MQKTSATPAGLLQSNVDELYRLELGMQNPRTYRGAVVARGWQADTFRGMARLSMYGAAGGRRNAFVRIPDKEAVIIILTNDDTADARNIADRITERMFPAGRSPEN
jgi:hypothetical protein